MPTNEENNSTPIIDVIDRTGVILTKLPIAKAAPIPSNKPIIPPTKSAIDATAAINEVNIANMEFI